VWVKMSDVQQQLYAHAVHDIAAAFETALIA
jgi:hypothetical protein